MGADRIIYIRTDGNSQIASGHLVRCFSIAQACKMLGMDVSFLVSDEESSALLREIFSGNKPPYPMQNQFEILCLTTAVYDNLEQELPEVCSLLSTDTRAIDNNVIYFIDSYFVTKKYLTTLRPFARVAYLDDLQLFDYPADLLINYDVIPDSAMSSYKAAYQNAGQLLLGAAYTPLRSQFQNRKISIKKQAGDILITTGGSDPCHFCLKLIHYLYDFINENYPQNAMFSGQNLHIVIGKLNTDKEALYRLAENNPFLHLHENVSDMASLMECCDLAVSASGTTLYELCALGIPTISFIMADNQLISSKAFEEAGAIPCAGDIRQEEKKVLQTITNFMTQMSQPSDNQAEHKNSVFPAIEQSYEIRKSAHKAMRRLVDGNGAMRIANALMKL